MLCGCSFSSCHADFATNHAAAIHVGAPTLREPPTDANYHIHRIKQGSAARVILSSRTC